MGLLGFVAGAAGAAQDNLVSQRKDTTQERRDHRLNQFAIERDEANHTRTMERDANKIETINDGQGNVYQMRGDGTTSPLMIDKEESYQMPEGSYFDEEDRQQAGGGLLSVSQEQLNVGGGKGRFQPFEHPELGWVQQGPDGKLHQFDPKKMPGGGGRGGGGRGGAMKPPTMTEMRQHYLLDSGLSEERIMLAAQSPGGLHSLIQEIGDAGKFGEWAADQYGIDVYAGQSIDGWESPLQRKPEQPGDPILESLKRNTEAKPPGAPVQPQGAPIQVSTPQEAAALPPGTQFITPDGQLRVTR